MATRFDYVLNKLRLKDDWGSTGSVVHNSTTGKQGGTTNEYYHLTSAEHTLATQLSSGTLTGLLSNTDWLTFNSKQDALGYTAANDSNVMHLTGNETAAGKKIFSNYVAFGSTANPLTQCYVVNRSDIVGTGLGMGSSTDIEWTLRSPGTGGGFVLDLYNGSTITGEVLKIERTGDALFKGGIAAAKGGIFYGAVSPFPTGVGTYVAAYVSGTYGARLLAYDGTTYQKLSLGTLIGATFPLILNADGTLQINTGSDSTGDVLYRNASGNMARLGIGTEGQVLTVASGVPVWATSSGGGLSWGATITGTSGTGLTATIGDSATAGTVAYSGVISNTQTGASTLMSLNSGTSAQPHKLIDLVLRNVSANARAVKIDLTSSTGTGIDISGGTNAIVATNGVIQSTITTINGTGWLRASNTDSWFQVDVKWATAGSITSGCFSISASKTIWNYVFSLFSADLTNFQLGAVIVPFNIDVAYTNNTGKNGVSGIIRETITSSGGIHNYDYIHFNRWLTSVWLVSSLGSAVKITNTATQTSGTQTNSVVCLSLVQGNISTGGHILFNSYVPTTEPTTAGTLWYNTSNISLRTGVREVVDTAIFSQTSDVTVANTTTETSMLGTGVGTATLPANFLIPGRVVRLKSRGTISTGTSQSSTVRFNIGGTTVITSWPSLLPNTLSNSYVEVELDIECRTTGATGTVIVHGRTIIEGGVGLTTASIRPLLSTSTITVDTTSALALDMTYQWAAADAANSLTMRVATIQRIW